MVSWAAVGAVFLPFVGGFTRKLFPSSQWYKELKKPPWFPPGWVIGPVWSILYATIGYASFRIYDSLGGFNDASKLPLGLYGMQLALNWAWIPLFFGAHKLKWSLVEMLALDAAALGTAVAFYQKDKTSGLLFVPYLIWLMLVTSINAWIWKNNDKKKE